MDISSIKKHLGAYSIDQKRRTTIHHAFASAIAPVDEYDPAEVHRAMKMLGQDSENLTCTYCSAPAESWDHLEPLVRATKFSGHGHTLGNLVPTCHRCNSRKGNRNWKSWLTASGKEDRIPAIQKYVDAYASRIVLEEELLRRFPMELRKLLQIKERVLSLLREADTVAKEMRPRSGPG